MLKHSSAYDSSKGHWGKKANFLPDLKYIPGVGHALTKPENCKCLPSPLPLAGPSASAPSLHLPPSPPAPFLPSFLPPPPPPPPPPQNQRRFLSFYSSPRCFLLFFLGRTRMRMRSGAPIGRRQSHLGYNTTTVVTYYIYPHYMNT